MVYAGRKRAAELLQPVYEKRVQERKEGKKGMDAVAWLIAASRWGRKGMLELADEQLFLTMASIHSTSATVLSTIYDLLDRPHCIPEILEEITTVAKENKNGQWTKQSLFKLEKLDSFMKESQRVNPAGLGKSAPHADANISAMKAGETNIETYSHGPTLRRPSIHLQRRFPHPCQHPNLLPQLRAEPRRRRLRRSRNLRSLALCQDAESRRAR